jgi:hypothetical protein
MRKLTLIPKIALAAVLTAAAFSTPAQSKPSSGCPRQGFCTEQYDPVICSNGVVYSNACFAYLACATGCVPYGVSA